MSSPLQSFRSKILALVAVAVVGMALLASLSVWQLRQQLIEGRQGQLVAAVQSAHTIVDGFRAQAAAGQMSDADARKAAQDALRLSRYGADGKDYFYIWTTEGVGVMHPIKPEWAGQQMVGKVKDGAGVQYFANKDRYEGGFRDDRMSGWGVFMTKAGDVYEGEFGDDQSLIGVGGDGLEGGEIGRVVRVVRLVLGGNHAVADGEADDEILAAGAADAFDNAARQAGAVFQADSKQPIFVSA